MNKAGYYLFSTEIYFYKVRSFHKISDIFLGILSSITFEQSTEIERIHVLKSRRNGIVVQLRVNSSRIVSARFEELQKHANDQAKRGEVEEGEQGARAYRNSFLHGFVPRLRNTQASVRDEGGGISVRLM